MHSHDRTLLSSLGFSDPDKRDPRHDLACRYLSLPEKQLKIMGLLPESIHRDGHDRRLEPSRKHPLFEKMIEKGEGKYRTTIGFVDLILWFQVRFPCPGSRCCTTPPEGMHTHILSLAVEVKISPVGVGDILRQINLYRAYERHFGWLLATAFALSPADVAVLDRSGIRHVRLGVAFDEWAEAQREAPVVDGSLSI